MNPNDKQKTQVTGTPSFNKEKILTRPTEPLLKDLSREEEISTEIKELGVVQKQEKVEIPDDLKEIGVRESGFSAPVSYKPTLHLPINDEKIEQGSRLKFSFSWRWLSEWCKLQLKKFHIVLKVIHGRVVRVKL